MPPLLHPSPPPDKEPPEKPNTYLPLSAPRPPIDTSQGMPPSDPQLPASPSIRPPFSPFFTLIHDTATATTYHPRNVHYIFSDDDPSLLTTACLSALSSHQQAVTSPTASSSTPSHPHPRIPSTSSSSAASKSPSSSTAVMQGKRLAEDRVLVLDLDASGTSITSAHSLSSSWQILSTSLTPAPTWDESPSEPSPPNGGGGGAAGGFMLKISGTDGRQMGSGGGKGTGLGLGKEARAGGTAGMAEVDFQALMLEFDSRMKILRTVVEAGGEVGQRLEAEGDTAVKHTDERAEEDMATGGDV